MTWNPDNGGPLTKESLLITLQRHIGKGKGITGTNLVKEIIKSDSHPATERHLRELILELRCEGHHICATPQDGYFIAANEAELNQTCDFLYERAMASLKQVSRMKNVSLPDLRGQLRLPT